MIPIDSSFNLLMAAESQLGAFGTCAKIWDGDGFSNCFRIRFLYWQIPLFVLLCSIGAIFYHHAWQSLCEWSQNHMQDRIFLFENHLEPQSDDIDTSKALNSDLFTKYNKTTEILLKKNGLFFSWNVLLFSIYIFGAGLSVASFLLQMNEYRLILLIFVTYWLILVGISFLNLILIRLKRISLFKYNYRLVLFLNTALACDLIAMTIDKFVSTNQIENTKFIPWMLLVLIGSELLLISTSIKNENLPITGDSKPYPAPEPYVSIFSKLTYFWIFKLLRKGNRERLNIDDVYELEEDHSSFVLVEAFRKFKKSNRLSVSVIRFLMYDYLKQAIYAFFGTIALFVSPLAMRGILIYIEDRNAFTKSMAWFFVTCLLFGDSLSSLFDGRALAIGRQVSIKLQAILVSEIYRKAVRRRDTSRSNTKEYESSNNDSKEKIDLSNNGAVFNLMAVDSSQLMDTTAYLHYVLVKIPVEFILSSYLLYRLLGNTAIIGIISTVLFLPINHFLATKFEKIQEAMMKITDRRISKMNEILTSIKVIKFFAWENQFMDEANNIRAEELKMLRKRYVYWAYTTILWGGTTSFIALVTLTSFVFFSGRRLDASLAFTAIALLDILKFPLDAFADMLTRLLQGKVSFQRIESFLADEETSKYNMLENQESSLEMKFDNATLSWVSKNEATDSRKVLKHFQLRNITVEFPLDRFTVIAGPTGSGKTSLLMALLGEMTLLDGSLKVPGCICRQTLPRDPDTGLIDSVAYCAQTAWIFNDSVRNNILFADEYDEERYFKVLNACALARDIEILGSDNVQIGEKGITLSGGQKQRVSLARALYSRARILLLDDCLSAIDAGTSEWIIKEVFLGDLIRNRTVVMVSLATSLVIPHADYIVYLENGQLKFTGGPSDLLSADNRLSKDEYLRKMILNYHEINDEIKEMEVLAESETDVSVESMRKAVPQGEVEKIEEYRSEGAPGLHVYASYVKGMGGPLFFVSMVLILALQQASIIANSITVRNWTQKLKSIPTIVDSASTFGSLEDYKQVSLKFVILMAVFTAARSIFISFFDFTGFTGSLRTSKELHNRLLDRVMFSKMRFFETTPQGQIMNRFSKDMEVIDVEITSTLLALCYDVFSMIAIIGFIITVTPKFMIVVVAVIYLFVLMTKFYLTSSRELKRLESITRSPLYQQFGETLSGSSTIRAYGEEVRFLNQNLELVNAHARPYYYYWMANRWLSVRSEIFAVALSFFTAVFVMYYIDSLDSGLAGISISYSLTFASHIIWIVRYAAWTEINMNSVERFNEYFHLESEESYKHEQRQLSSTPEEIRRVNQIAEQWPSEGRIEFENLYLRYSKELPAVIKGISLDIPGGTKVGIVGRTGAGKSTIASSLFRMIEPMSGCIKIDGIDLCSLPLSLIRSKLTIIPQDPMLFQRSIRYNLDPFNSFTDEQLFSVLKTVKLVSEEELQNRQQIMKEGSINPNIFLNLDAELGEGGGNLSVGQRQLICLARSLLKHSRVIIMDESTASIDHDLQNQILHTLLHEYDRSTVLTIAHRLLTVIDYDVILVLSHGEIKEYDSPRNLLAKRNSIFSSMCIDAGFYDIFCEHLKI